MPLSFDDAMLDEAKRFNAKLARMPRFGMRYRFMPRFGMRYRCMPTLIQGLLRLSQYGADRKLRRGGL